MNLTFEQKKISRSMSRITNTECIELEIQNCKNDLEYYKNDVDKKNTLMGNLQELTSKLRNEDDTCSTDICYNDADGNSDIPDYLFFNDNIMSVYGTPDLTNTVKFLENSKDQGKYYYDTRDKILYNSDVELYTSKLNQVKKDVDDYLVKILTLQQYQVLHEIKTSLTIHFSSDKKTKIAKFNLDVHINKLQRLSTECNINLQEWVSCIFQKKIKDTNNRKIDVFIHEKCSIYTEYLKKIESCKKFIVNTIKYSKIKFTEFNNRENILKQEGKYFKKWSKLNCIERKERIQNYLVFNNYTQYQDEHALDALYNVIKYQDLKWNVITGIIERIKILNTDGEIIQVKQKSIFNESSVPIINEHVLYYILTTDDKVNTCFSCIKYIGIKLKLEKLQKSDKDKISSIYKNMTKIINENKKK